MVLLISDPTLGVHVMRIKTEGVSWQEIDGELVILDLNRSVYLTTNAAGAELAKLLLKECTAEELANALVAKYEIPREQASADVQAFVAELADKKLLVG
jgi:hypothetical protein